MQSWTDDVARNQYLSCGHRTQVTSVSIVCQIILISLWRFSWLDISRNHLHHIILAKLLNKLVASYVAYIWFLNILLWNLLDSGISILSNVIVETVKIVETIIERRIKLLLSFFFNEKSLQAFRMTVCRLEPHERVPNFKIIRMRQ